MSLPQTEAFIKAHPDAKPVVDLIRATVGVTMQDVAAVCAGAQAARRRRARPSVVCCSASRDTVAAVLAGRRPRWSSSTRCWLRSLFNAPVEWADDVARGLMVGSSFFGAASARWRAVKISA